MDDALTSITDIVHDKHFLASNCIIRKRIPDGRSTSSVRSAHIMFYLQACKVVKSQEIAQHPACEPAAARQGDYRIRFISGSFDVVRNMPAQVINIVPIRYYALEFIRKYHNTTYSKRYYGHIYFIQIKT